MNITPAHLQTLCHIAQEAGQAIMDVYSQSATSTLAITHKADQSPLTQADLRADRIIRDGLTRHFGGVFIWSEESITQGSVHNVDTFFLVDPLDGTKEFINRNGEFTVNIALVQHGEPVAGVVLAPALSLLYYAAQGLGAFRQDANGITPLHTAPRPAGQPLRVIASRSHGSDALAQWLAAQTQPYTLINAGSSLKFCRLAEGSADLYPRFGPTSQWDTAAAHAVLQEAGGSVCTLNGTTLRYGLQHPVLNPHFVATATFTTH